MTTPRTPVRRWQGWILIAVTAAALALIAYALFRVMHRRVLVQAQKSAEVALKDRWLDHAFVPVEGHAQVCDVLRQAEAIRRLSESEPRTEALVGVLGHFLVAYTHGDGDSYEQFRFPLEPTLANAGWDGSQMDFYAGLARGLALEFGEASFAASNRLVMTSLFRRHRSLTNASPDVFGTRALASVAPGGIRAEVREYPVPGPSVTEWAWEDGAQNLTMPAPTLVYRYDAQTEGGGRVTVARVRLLCGSTLATRAFPVYLQFIWHAEAGVFLPTELMVPLGPMEVPDFLF